MRVVFISPHFPSEMENFTRGLKDVGAEVYGVADVPEHYLPLHVRRCLSGYLQVPSLERDDEVIAAVGQWMHGRTPDKVECLWEPFVVLAAKLREHFGIPGMSAETVNYFRDKDLMKQRVRAAGLRVPKSARARTVKEVWAALEDIGYPAIIKPIAGAGSADTYRLGSKSDAEKVMPRLGHVPEVNVEEFIDGEEFTFDAVSINGKAAFYSVTQYHPCPLQARSNEWISPAQITFRDLKQKKLAGGVKLGLAVLDAMKMGTGFTHMEWFLTSKGEVVFGEIGARSGGGHLVDMMNFSNDFDIFCEWARCVCFEKWDAPITRKYNVGMVFKRAVGNGRISRIVGMDRVRERCGNSIVWENLLPIGSPRRDWLQTLVSDGFVCVRNESYEEVESMRDFMVNEIKMYAD